MAVLDNINPELWGSLASMVIEPVFKDVGVPRPGLKLTPVLLGPLMQGASRFPNIYAGEGSAVFKFLSILLVLFFLRVTVNVF